MQSDKATLDEALQDFARMKSYMPFRLGGVWYVVQVAEGFRAFRTQKAACRNATGAECWKIKV